MTPEEIEALIREQSDAYKKASRRFGVGEVEKAVIGEAGNSMKRGARNNADKQDPTGYVGGFEGDERSHQRKGPIEDLRGGYGGAKHYGKSEKGLA